MRLTLRAFALGLCLALASVMPAAAQSPSNSAVLLPAGSCAAEDFSGTKLQLCVYLCEKSWMFTWQQRDAMLKSWLSLYRDVPPCYL